MRKFLISLAFAFLIFTPLFLIDTIADDTGMNSTSGMSSGGSMSGTNMANVTMNHMEYKVMAGNTSYQVVIESNAGLPKNVQFNQDQKSLIFDVSGLTARDLSHYEVTVPVVLLSGTFTVTVAANQVKAIAVTSPTGTTIHINIPSSFVKANGISDSATVTVTATQAIPEFPISATYVIIAAFAILTVILTRWSRSAKIVP